MGQCIGNCLKCTIVSDEEKVTCCTFQTLMQAVELRKTLKVIMARLDELPDAPTLPRDLIDPYDADASAAIGQEHIQ